MFLYVYYVLDILHCYPLDAELSDYVLETYFYTHIIALNKNDRRNYVFCNRCSTSLLLINTT